MKIGIISDSHYSGPHYLLPKAVKLAFSEVDLIIHAGDITNLSVIEGLEKIAPVKAVCGNKSGDHYNFSKKLPKHLIFRDEEFNFAVVHCPSNRLIKETSHIFSLMGLQKLSNKILLSQLLFYFNNEKGINCIIFGDTHQPFCQKRNNVLFLNPGASYPTAKRPGSVLVVETDKKEITCKFTYFPLEQGSKANQI